MKRYLNKLLSEVLGNMLANGQIRAVPIFNLDVPKENFGDFTTSVAHTIGREGKFQANNVADIIARELKALDDRGVIAEIKVLSGFINIFVAPEVLAQNVLDLQKAIKAGNAIEQVGAGENGKR